MFQICPKPQTKVFIFESRKVRLDFLFPLLHDPVEVLRYFVLGGFQFRIDQETGLSEGEDGSCLDLCNVTCVSSRPTIAGKSEKTDTFRVLDLFELQFRKESLNLVDDDIDRRSSRIRDSELNSGLTGYRLLSAPLL